MKGFIHHIQEVMRFMQLPKEQRRLTFYSEGKNYWVHLKGLIREMLATSDIPICYISSGYDDPGLLLQHDNYHVFKILMSRGFFCGNKSTSYLNSIRT